MRDQIVNIHQIIERATEFQKKKICFIDYIKSFNCVNHNKLYRILQEMRIPDHLTYLLRNLYACQEASVRMWDNGLLQIGKGIHQGCILSPCLFNLYIVYIMWLDWMKKKLESGLQGEISKLQICMQIIPP